MPEPGANDPQSRAEVPGIAQPGESAGAEEPDGSHPNLAVSEIAPNGDLLVTRHLREAVYLSLSY